MGREKLTEHLLHGRSVSGTVPKLLSRLCAECTAEPPSRPPRSALTPRAITRGGDAGGVRICGCMLAARRLGGFPFTYCDGSAGNGGALAGVWLNGPELVDGR
jgi:hypothetical protein